MKSRVPPVALAGVLAALVAGQIALSAPERSSASPTLGALPAHGAGAAARRAIIAARREDLKRGFLVARVRRSLGVRTRPGGRVTARIGPRTDFGSPRVLAVAAMK